jgi:methionyl-tRNA formyltransferase
MQLVFMGSPQFAVPILEALVASFDVVGIITQPDRPGGRGRKPIPPPAKLVGQQHSIEVFQPEKISSRDASSWLEGAKPEVIVVAAYGQILPGDIVNSYRCVNVHASLLPRWRGAAPISAAILAGDHHTGISLMQMDEGLDTGPVFAQRKIDIEATETTGDLTRRLSGLGAEFLIEELPSYHSGNSELLPQDDSEATYAPMIKKTQGEIDFNLPAEYISRQVRAFEPWPTSYFFWEGKRIVVRRAHAVPHPHPIPGSVHEVDGEVGVECHEGMLFLDTIQPEGRKAMSTASFIRGTPTFLDASLSE